MLATETASATLDSDWRQPVAHYVARNPAFRWLVGSQLSVLRFSLILSCWYLVAYIVCRIDGSLRIPGHVGLLDDYVMGVLFVLLTSVIATVRLMLRRLETVLKTLPHIVKGSDVHRVEQEAADRIRQFVAIETPGAKKWHRRVMILGGMLVFIFQILIPLFGHQSIRAWAIWPQRFPFSYSFAIVWAVFYWILVLGNVLWYAAASAIQLFIHLKRVSDARRLLVVPIAPDGKGGLAVLGRFSFSLALIGATGLTFVLAWLVLYGLNLALVLGFIAYTLTLAFLFLFPLLSVHSAMKDARQEELHRLAGLFCEAYDRLPASPRANGPVRADPETYDTVGYLSSLDGLYERARAMPLWPFNPATISQFFVLIVLPVISFIAEQYGAREWAARQLHLYFG